MAKIANASDFLRRCMDGRLIVPQKLRMAKTKRRPTQRYQPSKIRQERKKRKLTLERLAEAAGMTAGNLSQIERGNQPYAQDTLESVAKALGMHPAELLSDDAAMPPELRTILLKATPDQRQLLVEISKNIVKTGS